MVAYTFDETDINELSPAARAELREFVVRKFGGIPTEIEAAPMDDSYSGIDMEDVVNLSDREVRKWMEKASDKTKLGLKLFAEKPVRKASELEKAGVENLSHFQSRTTIRTRTITGNRDAFLLGWDDWSAVPVGKGRYAVTPATHQALRHYFKLG